MIKKYDRKMKTKFIQIVCLLHMQSPQMLWNFLFNMMTKFVDVFLWKVVWEKLFKFWIQKLFQNFFLNHYYKISSVEVHRTMSLMSSFLLLQHVLLLFLRWLARWELSGHTAAVLLSAASMISLKQHTTSLCGSYMVFFF